jgi:glycosyltransferase involved in cell wall biosynthesis
MKRELDRQYLKGPVGYRPALPSGRSLAVLIVADGGALETCLASLAEQLPELPVYVHDDGDGESPGPALAARYPHVHWVPGTAKAGFAAAFNALAEHAPGDADLLLLDAGARVLGPLTRTRELLREPSVAAVSPMARDDSAPGWASWDIATRRRTLVRELAADYRRARRGTLIAPLYARQPGELQGIAGDLGATCLAISRAAWNIIGGFDEEFLRFGAASDWQARARAAGWRMLLADELGVERAGLDAEDGTAAERRRERDLARANTALLLEHQHSVHHADVYLAGTTLLERLRRGPRRTAHAGRRTDLPSIVITTNRLVYGGAERQKALLARELDRRGYPVTIVCVQRFGPMISEIPDTVRVVRQPWWAPVVDIPEGPAVLITADTNTEAGFATLWRAAAAGRRWLVAPHVPPEEDRPIYSRPLTAAMRRADGFIVLAQRHWDMLVAQHRLWGRRFVAPNGVALAGDPAPRVRTAGEPLHLVMLSRIVEHKNPHLLVEALGDLPDLPWRLSIFGDGPDRERLQARTPAALRDRVQWRGWSAGPGPALADADLLCVPSRSEAFPLVILEAMARAVPVAASAICAVPEMLDFGGAGFLVEPVSVPGWRASLAQILADPAALSSVGRRGFERMRKHYTVEAMTDAYLDAVDAVL